MPKPSELPDGLRDFAFRQAAGVDTEYFHSHVDKVIASIDRHLSSLNSPEIAKPPPTQPATVQGETKQATVNIKTESQGAVARRLRAEVEKHIRAEVEKHSQGQPEIGAVRGVPVWIVGVAALAAVLAVVALSLFK
jgi:hypothetical protein